MTETLHTDFAVVGSGAGGGVTAYLLARAGERVTVLERGRRVPPSAMSEDELAALATLYKDGGSQMNSTQQLTLLQGNVLGGSTVLANCVCFRLPEDVRQEYAHHGFELLPDRLEQAYRRVESVLNVHETREEVLNPVSFKLEQGMRSLGIEPQRFRHASIDCNGCGYCNIGCRFGAKLDSSRTWIPMAEARGADVRTEIEVERIEHRGGAVRALLCKDHGSGRRVRVVARRYVLCGGGVNTPELLLKSGILTDRAGSRMSMNAGAMMVGRYPEPVDGFRGIQMGVYHIQDRYTIEQDHNPYLSFCMTQPIWLDREKRREPELYRHLTTCGVLTPIQSVGQVFLPPLRRLLPRLFQRAEIDIHLPEADRRVMVEGYKQLVAIYLASGCDVVYAPTHHKVEMRTPEDAEILDEVLADPRMISGLGSAHPMGGAPAGDDARRDVVTPEFRVRGLDNCFVADASLFPTSMGVNPMVSIMATADYASSFIAGVEPPDTIEEGPAHAWRMQQSDPRAHLPQAASAVTTSLAQGRY